MIEAIALLQSISVEWGHLASAIESNFTDYLSEAHCTLKLDGQLHVIEATSRFSDHAQFQTDLEALGFVVVSVQDVWKFTHIRALKTERRPQEVVKLAES